MAPGSTSLAVAALFILTLWTLGEGSKLLVIPQDGSHWLSMRPVVDELQQRGHEIVLLVPETNFMIQTSPGCIVKTYSVPFTKEHFKEYVESLGHSVLTERSFLEEMQAVSERISKFTEMMLSTCQSLLGNTKLIGYLRESHFDALFMDPMFPCGQIVAEYLSIPTIYFMRSIPCSFNQEAAVCPSPTSYVPRLFTSLTDRMMFPQRVKNILFSLFDAWICRALYAPYGLLASQLLQREMTALELFSGASVWLLRYEFVFEFPRPVMPNMVFIGGINCAGRKPLSQVGANWLITSE